MIKRFVLFMVVGLIALSTEAQATFNLGIKGGANFSKISFNASDYTSDAVVKTHFGAFGRIGWDIVFIQPEVYFSGKGGDLKSGINSIVTSFDYSTVDVPILLGIKIIKGETFDLHALGGPVFSGITTKKVSDNESIFNKSFYENHYFGVQYGIGIDLLFLTFDARMENGLNDFYKSQLSSDMKNNTFMLSVGFKLF